MQRSEKTKVPVPRVSQEFPVSVLLLLRLQWLDDCFHLLRHWIVNKAKETQWTQLFCPTVFLEWVRESEKNLFLIALLRSNVRTATWVFKRTAFTQSCSHGEEEYPLLRRREKRENCLFPFPWEGWIGRSDREGVTKQLCFLKSRVVYPWQAQIFLSLPD